MSKLLYNIDALKHINTFSSVEYMHPYLDFFTDCIKIFNSIGFNQNTFIHKYKDQEFNLFDSFGEVVFYYRNKMNNSDNNMIDQHIKKYLEEGIRFSSIEKYQIFDYLVKDKLKNDVVVANTLANNNEEFIAILSKIESNQKDDFNISDIKLEY